MELVDIDDIAEMEPPPLRHLSVVGSGFDSSDVTQQERAG
jgi:hypothetical protein